MRPEPAPISGSTSSLAGRIEVRARLVEQQQLGVVQHGPGDRHALHHPTGECPQRLVGAVCEPHGREHLLDAILPHAVQARVEAQVLARGQLAVEQRLVAEQPDAPAHGPGVIAGGSRPSTVTRPAWGRSSVASTLSSVVLPAPFGPNTTKRLPGAPATSDTSLRASRSP